MMPTFLYLELTRLVTVHWVSGEVTLNNETQLPIFTPTMSGFLDWGISAYAAAGQTLPASSLASTTSGVQHDRWISYGKQWSTSSDIRTKLLVVDDAPIANFEY